MELRHWIVAKEPSSIKDVGTFFRFFFDNPLPPATLFYFCQSANFNDPYTLPPPDCWSLLWMAPKVFFFKWPWENTEQKPFIHFSYIIQKVWSYPNNIGKVQNSFGSIEGQDQVWTLKKLWHCCMPAWNIGIASLELKLVFFLLSKGPGSTRITILFYPYFFRFFWVTRLFT